MTSSRSSRTRSGGKPALGGDLVERRVAVELLTERPARPGDLAHLVGDVDGQPDRSALLGERAGDRLANPPGCVRRKLEAELVVELLDRADQTQVAFLDQVQQRHTGLRVGARDRHHEPQVGFDQLALGLLVTGVLAARELALLRRGEQAAVTDLADVELERVLRQRLDGTFIARFRDRVEQRLGEVPFHGCSIGGPRPSLEGRSSELEERCRISRKSGIRRHRCAESRDTASAGRPASTGRWPRRRCSQGSRSEAATLSASPIAVTARPSSSASSGPAPALCSTASRSRPTRASCSCTSVTTRRATPGSRRTTIPSVTAPSSGSTTGSSRTTTRCSSVTGCERAEPEMTVDSEAIFALVDAYPGDHAALEQLRGRDGGRMARRARAGRALPRPRRRAAALARARSPRAVLRLDPEHARARGGHARAAVAKGGTSPRAGSSASSPAGSTADSASTPTRGYREQNILPAVRAPHEGARCRRAPGDARVARVRPG